MFKSSMAFLNRACYICRKQDFIVDDTTLFRVVLHLPVVFTEQLFAALVGSGGNRRLLLASLHNRYFIVRTGHFVSLLSVIGGWGGVLPPLLGQKKSRQPFSDFLLGVPLYGRRLLSCKSSGQVDPMCEWQIGNCLSKMEWNNHVK